MHAYHISQTFRVIIKSYRPSSSETQHALEIVLLLSQMMYRDLVVLDNLETIIAFLCLSDYPPGLASLPSRVA